MPAAIWRFSRWFSGAERKSLAVSLPSQLAWYSARISSAQILAEEHTVSIDLFQQASVRTSTYSQSMWATHTCSRHIYHLNCSLLPCWCQLKREGKRNDFSGDRRLEYIQLPRRSTKRTWEGIESLLRGIVVNIRHPEASLWVSSEQHLCGHKICYKVSWSSRGEVFEVGVVWLVQLESFRWKVVARPSCLYCYPKRMWCYDTEYHLRDPVIEISCTTLVEAQAKREGSWALMGDNKADSGDVLDPTVTY